MEIGGPHWGGNSSSRKNQISGFDALLVAFPVSVMKCPGKNNAKKKGLVNFGSQLKVGKSRQ